MIITFPIAFYFHCYNVWLLFHTLNYEHHDEMEDSNGHFNKHMQYRLYINRINIYTMASSIVHYVVSLMCNSLCTSTASSYMI